VRNSENHLETLNDKIYLVKLIVRMYAVNEISKYLRYAAISMKKRNVSKSLNG